MHFLILHILQFPMDSGRPASSDAAVLVASFVSQLKVNGVAAWIIQQLKKSEAPALAWISHNTPWVTRGIGLLAAAGTSAGLHWTYNASVAGGTFMITGLSIAAVVMALWHVGQNYLFQHAWYKAVFSDPPKPQTLLVTGPLSTQIPAK